MLIFFLFFNCFSLEKLSLSFSVSSKLGLSCSRLIRGELTISFSENEGKLKKNEINIAIYFNLFPSANISY